MLVIGGLISSVNENDGSFIPGTSNIPFFKYLFGYEEKTSKKRELIILLRPTNHLIFSNMNLLFSVGRTNMDRLKYLVIGILALFLAGCGKGQVVVETLNVAEGPSASAAGNGKSIVILPFADYSEGNLASAQRRNMLVTEALTDRLVVNGFSLPIQEDVFDYLVE